MSTQSTKQNARRNQKMQRIALRFLSNIYMSSEQEQSAERGNTTTTTTITTNGSKCTEGKEQLQELGVIQRLPSVEEYIREHQDGGGHEQTNAIRIQGRKYQYTRRPVAAAAVHDSSTNAREIKRHEEQLKKWRSDALSNGLHRGRLFLSAQSSYPVLCFSVLNYDASTEKAAKRKRAHDRLALAKGIAATITVGKRGRYGVSYVDLFGPRQPKNNAMNRPTKDLNKTSPQEEKIDATMATSKLVLPAATALLTTKDSQNKVAMSSTISMASSASTSTANTANTATTTTATATNTTITTTTNNTNIPFSSVENYDPNYLDDGTIKQGKSRLITSGPSHRHSFLPYVKRKNLKDEINAQFVELHPWLPTSMSLSKIRTLKRESLEQWKKYDLELSTLALGIVYFERLVIKTLVMKTNRKIKFAACLLIAFKFNEGEFSDVVPMPPDGNNNVDGGGGGVGGVAGEGGGTEQATATVDRKEIARVQHLFESIESALGIHKKELFKIELQVFAELDFDLCIPPEKVLPHLMRLLDTLDITAKDYLGTRRMKDLGLQYEEDEEDEEDDEAKGKQEHPTGSSSRLMAMMMSSDENKGVFSDLSDVVTL